MKTKAHRIDLGCLIESGASGACVFQSENNTFLSFRASFNGENEKQRALVRFTFCSVSKFGYPNDEAFGGHPLYEEMNGFYQAWEIENSPWLNELNEQNNQRFPCSDIFSNDTHYIFGFHDTTFECVATGYTVEAIEDNLDTIMERIKAPLSEQINDYGTIQ